MPVVLVRLQVKLEQANIFYQNFPISNSMSNRSPILDFLLMKRNRGRRGTDTVDRDVIQLRGGKNVSKFWKKPYIHSSENLYSRTQSRTKWNIFGIRYSKTYRMHTVGATVLTRVAGGHWHWHKHCAWCIFFINWSFIWDSGSTFKDRASYI